MRYQKLIEILGKEGIFDLASVVQLTGERRESIRMQLHRFCKDGKLTSLRRGMYAFTGAGVKADIDPVLLASKLYFPSYISTLWAMGYYGLIPEKVVTYTSVSTRVTRLFDNNFGLYKYQSLKRSAFFGYRVAEISGVKVMLAEPEKALLDFWYLSKGPWSKERMEEMRFQNADIIDVDKLCASAERFNSLRLVGIVALWKTVMDSEYEGEEL